MSKSKTKHGSETIVEELANSIRKANQSAKFLVTGCLPVADPGLDVEGLGRVPVPLIRGRAKALIAKCKVAPFGKGTKTLVDTSVRKTYELDPKNFKLGEKWNSTIKDATRRIAYSLGLPPDRLEARLYKLLVYEKGGFFLPHRDSEKHDRMVASLVVVLPNPFEGGKLIIRHGAIAKKLEFEEAKAGKAACFAAFYADCEHEIERVSSGVRIALAYNLVLKQELSKPSDTSRPTTVVDRVAEALGIWVTRQPGKPLVFALAHHYTERGLALDLLKGTDRPLADIVVSAAAKADCMVHLAQVSRHLLQFADDGSFGDSYSRYSYRAPRRHAIEIGETYEDELTGTEWADLQGKKQPWGSIAFDLPAIVSSEPIDSWKPTREYFEGYTGNEGNTLDRWYHRSAIVVWHRDHHYEVVASSGAAVSIPLFFLMVKKLAKTPKKRLEEARRDCIRFAHAIVAHWPSRYTGYRYGRDTEEVPFQDFPNHLLMLHDRDTIGAFLTKLAERDQVLPLKSFLKAACGEFGWTAFAQELRQLLSTGTDDWRQPTILLRDVEWLALFCCAPTLAPDESELAGDLCEIAVNRFCETPPKRQTYYRAHVRKEVSGAEKALPFLLQALAACDRDDDLTKVIRFVQDLPEEFRLDDCQVPALKLLIPWSQKRFGSVHPQFNSWLKSVRGQLERATASKPTPPADWSRQADVNCDCQYCAKVNEFLVDSANEVSRIPAREEIRGHLIAMIDRHQCDVKHALERKGSPYSLVLTKTTGSFERALKRYEMDCKLLSELPVVS